MIVAQGSGLRAQGSEYRVRVHLGGASFRGSFGCSKEMKLLLQSLVYQICYQTNGDKLTTVARLILI
jgi:hypothetical protein